MSSSHGSYFRYWGKARTEGEGPRYHMLPYHCLDVAAAGDELLRAQPSLVAGVAEFLGVEADALRRWLVALLAAHDVGKLGDGFQNLRPDLLAELQGRTSSAGYDERHDTLGFRLLTAKDGSPRPLDVLAGNEAGRLDPEDLRELLLPWLAASAGHHGRPPALRGWPKPLSHQFPPAVRADAAAFVRDVFSLFSGDGVPFDLTDYDRYRRAFPRVSWLAAGLAVAADWIGSNEAWFPYVDEPMPLEDYWRNHALPQARTAVAESGVPAVQPSAWKGLRSLFPAIEVPTPLQGFAERLELSDYPQVFVVEEVTGGGKTEAALALAHRLMARGAADGVYFALPTMATANAMHRRVEKMFRGLFGDGPEASLVLAHSASRMALDLEEKNRASRAPDGAEETASRQCADWLADSRKKALLAQVGVGTIDQALLAVLAARHQSLRLFGLCRKVLVVDEVHACDAYVNQLLCTLLRFHAALGGSAVLLSATLPARTRAELVRAFGDGLGVDRPILRDTAYPLVTYLTAEGLREHPIEARPNARRRVAVPLLHSEEDVASMLSRVLEAGGCACWVRNTVDDALEAYRAWAERLGEDRVTLFHARFTLGDRLARESEVLRVFGPESSAAERGGRLLIATQVVEQSLDLDFDGMISDLAPIDLLIQRTGRLKRHARDAAGNRVEGRDRRSPPELGVFLPEPTAEVDARWFSGAFPRAAWVYENHGQLWLTARWLRERLGFSTPEDARNMIEAVYGSDVQDDIPPGLATRTLRAEGSGKAKSAQGRLNSLNLDAGYFDPAKDAQWQDDAYAPTRLGDPTTTVRLARREGARLGPWASGDPRHAWQLSQLTVRRTRISAEAANLPEEALSAARESMPDRGKHCVVVVLEETSDGHVGSAVDGNGRSVRVRYDARFGLQYLGGDTP
ncbi:MAG: CRISPR-associated helicase Cas3' [Deferrisomatales bacterium]|nr:CRISPR-associated helicase Cas3' [Deferrisomatales bacterium]